MKMIRAILRPETAEKVADSLADAGFVSMTQVHVFGRGKHGAYTGNFGDGKVFVSPVEEAYTVRTGIKGL